MSTARIVLLGGSGFLGQALAADLAARGNEVVILKQGFLLQHTDAQVALSTC